MRLLVYEWCCSGGLTDSDRNVLVPLESPAADLEPLAREGRAMFTALISDGCGAEGLELHALVDATRPLVLPGCVQVHPVAVGEERTALVAAARGCDAVLIVAPETGGIFAARVAAVRAAGVDVIAPGPNFIALASDKQATILALAAAGVPVPAGRRLATGEAWPSGFHRPAVGKRLDGVGCDGLVFVGRHEAFPLPVRVPLRIEAAVEGLPVGVSCILGSGRIHPLPPLIQRFSAEGATGYIGGAPLTSPGLRERATRLALRSVVALERAVGDKARGWVGVDMIMGGREDGHDDRVLELNPRLTTSFVGHAAAARDSVVARLVAGSGGSPPIDPEPHSFDLVTHAPA
jgi:predicted ATP-grasp superfamily ATP-dependent carboligase